MPKLQWKDRYGPWALITGASSGIGESFACELAKRGLNIILIGRDQQRLEYVSQKCQAFQVETFIIKVDLSDIHEVLKIKEVVGNRCVGLIINNAGFGLYGPFLQNSLKTYLDMVNIHCHAVLSITHQFLPSLISAKKGGIIFVASTSSFQAIPNSLVYSATKAFDLYIGEGITEEIRGSGVDVLTLAPGFVETPFFNNSSVNLNKFAPRISPQSLILSALKKLGNKNLVIPGFTNKLFFMVQKFLPRDWVVKIAKFYLLHLWKSKTPSVGIQNIR